MISNLGDPMSLRHPVDCNTLEIHMYEFHNMP